MWQEWEWAWGCEVEIPLGTSVKLPAHIIWSSVWPLSVRESSLRCSRWASYHQFRVFNALQKFLKSRWSVAISSMFSVRPSHFPPELPSLFPFHPIPVNTFWQLFGWGMILMLSVVFSPHDLMSVDKSQSCLYFPVAKCSIASLHY